MGKTSTDKLTKAHPAFDQLAQFSFGIPNYYRYFEAASEGPTFIRLHNPQTLIVGDRRRVQAFLKAKGQFPLQRIRSKTGAPPDPGPNPPKDSKPMVPPPPGPAPPGLSPPAEKLNYPVHRPAARRSTPARRFHLDRHRNAAWIRKLTFRIAAGGQATMIDKKGNAAGTWNETGNNVTLVFGGRVTYRGVVNGNSMQGNAADGNPSGPST